MDPEKPADGLPDPQPIDYARPIAPAGYRPPPVSLGTALYIWAFSGVVVAILVYVVPRLETVFQSYHMELPVGTQMMLAVSRWFVNGWLWVPFLAIGIGLPFALNPLLATGQPDEETFRRRNWWARRLLFLLALLLCAWIVFASFIPYVELVNTISNGK